MSRIELLHASCADQEVDAPAVMDLRHAEVLIDSTRNLDPDTARAVPDPAKMI